jgi:hypothetical protein
MLHHPWRSLNHLYYNDIDEEIKSTYHDVYGNCAAWHNHNKDGLDDNEETFNFNNASTQGKDDAYRDAQDIDASFSELANRLPDAAGLNVNEPNRLGWRGVDDVDWMPCVACEPINPDFWKESKGEVSDDYHFDDVQGDYDGLDVTVLD